MDDQKIEMPSLEHFQTLVTRANDGDQIALDELCRTLDAHPEIWKATGDMARHAEERMLATIGEANRLVAESVRRHATEMREQLAGPQPSLLEQLAVQRIVATWVFMQYVEQTFPGVSGSPAHAKFGLQARESAQRQFTLALKSLELVRRIQLPASKTMPATAASNGAAARGASDHGETNGHTHVPLGMLDRFQAGWWQEQEVATP